MKKELQSVQYLRGVAAMLVVFVHLPLQLTRMGYAGAWPFFPNMGVDIFFVISGFIMWSTTCDQPMTVRQFLHRRIARIAPLYWLLTAITVVLLLVAPAVVQSGKFDAIHVVKSFLFIAATHPVLHDVLPVLVPGWTLNLEMFFYVIFALCLPLPMRWRAAAVVIALIALTGSHRWLAVEQSPAGFYTTGIMLEFAYGVVLGVVFRRPAPQLGGRTLAWFALGGTVASLWLLRSTLPREVALGVPALLLVAGGLLVEQNGWLPTLPLMRKLGDASYSMYLTHGIVLSGFGQVWRTLGLTRLPLSLGLFSLSALVIISAVALLTYRWVERPLSTAFREAGRPLVAARVN